MDVFEETEANAEKTWVIRAHKWLLKSNRQDGAPFWGREDIPLCLGLLIYKICRFGRGSAVNCPFARLTMSGERSYQVFIFRLMLFFAGPRLQDKPSSHKCIYEWIKSPVSQHLFLQMAIYPREMSFEVRAASVRQTHSVAVSGGINQLNFSHSGTCAIRAQKWKLSSVDSQILFCLSTE